MPCSGVSQCVCACVRACVSVTRAWHTYFLTGQELPQPGIVRPLGPCLRRWQPDLHGGRGIGDHEALCSDGVAVVAVVVVVAHTRQTQPVRPLIVIISTVAIVHNMYP